ncbi:cAMP-dependent protein kinase inhibitor beta-like protein [Sarcoptes scabiei]|uniref:cAMP-dependent protein kinase inhibitor beta-like protein n=1 Tax=Sarcoptes scabiei TaxID=52283 RepID=A0A132A5L4_SARSC|nr:cAMP-dependent protein kinase inhibitor beta-like protein [Sarcoptes scabiei]
MDDVSGADNHHPKQQSSTSASIPSSSQFFDPQQQQQQQMAQNLGPEMKVVIVDEFLNTGRTGRRNALGDILDENTAHLSTSALPDQLSSLTFSNAINIVIASTIDIIFDITNLGRKAPF